MTPFFSLSLQSVLLLGAVVLVCLALDLLFLLFYSFWLCCRRRKNQDSPNADCCCTAWCVIIATLVCRSVVCTLTQLNTKCSSPCCLHAHIMWQYTSYIPVNWASRLDFHTNKSVNEIYPVGNILAVLLNLENSLAVHCQHRQKTEMEACC